MIRKNKRLAINTIDDRIAHVVCMQVLIVGCKNMLVQALPQLYALNPTLNLALLLLIGLSYVWVFMRSINRFLHIPFSVAIIIVFVSLSFLVTWIVYPNNISSINTWILKTVPYCFITSLLISFLKSLQQIEFYMESYSKIIVIVSVISAIFIQLYGHTTTGSSYSMPLSYAALIGVMWSLYLYFQKKNKISVIYAVLGSLVILFYGARNPLLAIATYCLFEIVKNLVNKDVSTKTKIGTIIIVLLTGIAAFNWEVLIRKTVLLLTNFGINSRSLFLLLTNATYLSGRDVIHEELLMNLSKHPFLGLGIGGDVIATEETSHGFFLSILSSYGIPIGALVISLIIILCIFAYRKANQKEKEVLMIYMCMVFPRGFTGGDIWTNDVFWWMLALCLVVINNKRISYESSQSNLKYRESIQ